MNDRGTGGPGVSRRQVMRRGAVLALGGMLPVLPGLASPAARALAEDIEAGARSIPARLLPPPRSVSPALRARATAPYPPGWDIVPADAAAWRRLAAASAAGAESHLIQIKDRLGVQAKPDVIAGVPVFRVSAENPPANRTGQVLMHLHGGGYVLFPGEAGAGEAMLMAGHAGFDVVSVDYRMPPDHPFPAALEDATAVWKALCAKHDPRRMAVFGSSAGGGLTLALMLKARQEGLPLPAAIAPGTPWCDLAATGDSLAANAYVDNVLVAETGWVGAAAPLYAAGRDLTDPLISPLYGDVTGLPPTILTSGTRDLLLSDTVRMHRHLRRAGVDAVLQVFEGQSHAQFLDPFVPETEEAFLEIARFLEARLRA